MTNEEMLHEINALPLEAQRQIEDLIAVLRRRYESSPSTTIVVTDPLANEEFVGMWRDRNDMVDSTRWVRTIRQSHWSK